MIIPMLLAQGELGIISQIQVVLSNLFIVDFGDHIELVSATVFKYYTVKMLNDLLL